MSTGSIRLHRVLRAVPERVYRAFLEADALAKWIPPYGFTCTVHHIGDPNLPGEMQVTVTLKPVSCGTELAVVQEGIPEAIPLEMCHPGWQESLAQLATLVEPEIPG
jgi:uncharacterized protein YndB with AHSA1/START domain